MDQFQRGHPYFSKNSGEMLKVKPDPPRIQSSVPSLERQIHSRLINEISSDAPNRTSTHDVLPLNRVRSDFETTFKLDTPMTLSNRFPPKDDVTNNGNIASPESSSMISAKDSLKPPFDCESTYIETIERISGNSVPSVDTPEDDGIDLGGVSENVCKESASTGSIIHHCTTELAENEDSLTEEYKKYIHDACLIPEASPDNSDLTDCFVSEKERKCDGIWSELSTKPKEKENEKHVEELISEERVDFIPEDEIIEKSGRGLGNQRLEESLVKLNSICLNYTGQTVDSIVTEYKNDEDKPEMNNKDKEIQFVHEQQTHLIETSDTPISQEPEEDSDQAPQTISTDSYSSERQESSIKEHFENFENPYTLTKHETELIDENNSFFESGQDSVLPDTREVMSWSQMVSEHQITTPPVSRTPRISESDNTVNINEFDSLMRDFEIINEANIEEDGEVPETM